MSRVKPDLESGMMFLLSRLTTLPPPLREHKIVSNRKFRFDFAWPDRLLAIELEGGIWMQGRTGHSSRSGIARDMAKGNLAVLQRWRVLRYSAKDLKERPVQVAQEITQAYHESWL